MRTIALLVVIVLGLLGCDNRSSADKDLSEKTEKFMREANAQVGMPAIKNFQERKLAKMIFELRDKEDLICYAYIVSMDGKLVYLGKCLGFGLPYSVQYTNPMKVERIYHGNEGVAIPQPDPNGLFMPEGLSATWLMMIDPKTSQARPVYIEPQIIVSPFPLE